MRSDRRFDRTYVDTQKNKEYNKDKKDIRQKRKEEDKKNLREKSRKENKSSYSSHQLSPKQ